MARWGDIDILDTAEVGFGAVGAPNPERRRRGALADLYEAEKALDAAARAEAFSSSRCRPSITSKYPAVGYMGVRLLVLVRKRPMAGVFKHGRQLRASILTSSARESRHRTLLCGAQDFINRQLFLLRPPYKLLSYTDSATVVRRIH